MYKALFFDIDGTLVSFNTHKIPQTTVNALQKVHAKGIKIFISTGRPKYIINNLAALQELNLIDGYITMNGAYCFIGNTVIYKSAIPKTEVQTIADFCTKSHYACVFVAEHKMYTYNENKALRDIFYDYLNVSKLPDISLEDATKSEMFQITPFITKDEESILMPDIPNCECSRWFPAFADITARGNTKQKGIDKIINHFGIKLSETMAFGDGGNDISMLRHAAVGIAMDNANDEVKQSANYITSSVDDNGIYNALKYFEII